jgi:O-antigen/teichoic acid export membrane protein
VTTTKQGGGASRFGLHALVYLVSTLLMRGLWIVLTPFYTRVMSPQDFAVVAVANTLTTALGIVLGVAIYGGIPRLYFEHATDESRRRYLGTVLLFSLAFPAGAGVLLEVVGILGGLDIFATVPFRPYLELVLWTAVLSNLLNLPTTVYMTREEPRKVALLNLASGATQLVVSILLVGFFRQGALGVIRAGFFTALLMGVLSVVLMSRMSRLTLSFPDLRPMLAYSLPLVPHLLANWALSVSDRLVLERYVSAAELARYSLAYLFSTGVSVIAGAVATPITAAANRQLGDPETAKAIPPLGTYALLITVSAALLVSVNAAELVSIFAPSAYGGAAAFVPWVAAGAALQGVYLVWSTGTWYSKKTGAIPLVTLACVVVNLGINLALVPRYGALVAAISTAVAYAVAAVLHGLLAHRNHPIAWEYRRWVSMFIAALVSFAALRWLTFGNVIVALLLKSSASLTVFGAILVTLGFVSRGDLSRGLSGVRRRLSWR